MRPSAARVTVLRASQQAPSPPLPQTPQRTISAIQGSGTCLCRVCISCTGKSSHASISTAPPKKITAAPPSVNAALNSPKPSRTAVPPSRTQPTEKQNASEAFKSSDFLFRCRIILSHRSPSSRSRALRWFLSVIISTSIIPLPPFRETA